MIDVHHHIIPAAYLKAVGHESISVQGSSGKVPHWDVSNSLQKMDEAGIASAITSISAPGLAPLKDASARSAVARGCNEFASEMCQSYPSRFGMFATLPMPDVDATLKELRYAFDKLNVDGVCLLSNYAGTYLGDKAFEPIFEDLNERAAVVFIHPTATADLPFYGGVSASTMEFPFDTSRTAVSLILAGIPRRFPSIKFILSHGGGTIPFLAHRIETLTANNPLIRKEMPAGFSAELKNFYFDCTLSSTPESLALLRAISSSDNLLFGTDYPFGPKNQMSSAMAAAKFFDPNLGSVSERLRSNAIALFPRFNPNCR